MAEEITVHRLEAGPNGRPPAGSPVGLEAEQFDHAEDLPGGGSTVFYVAKTTKPPLKVQETSAQIAALFAA